MRTYRRACASMEEWVAPHQKPNSFKSRRGVVGSKKWAAPSCKLGRISPQFATFVPPHNSLHSFLQMHFFGRAMVIRCPNEYMQKRLQKCLCKLESDSDCRLKRECPTIGKEIMQDDEVDLRSMAGVETDTQPTDRFPGMSGLQKFPTIIKKSLSIADSEAIRMGLEETSVNIAALAKEESFVGAVSLIIGTSVGAGILALPAKTVNAGFFPSAMVLGFSWSFLVAEALIIAKVNVDLMNTFSKSKNSAAASQVISLRSMANHTLGSVGGYLAALIYLLLTYTLLVAYIAKVDEVLMLFHFPASMAGILFSFGFGGLLYLGGNKNAQNMNTVLTAALIGIFLLILGEGAMVGDWENLQHVDWKRVPEAIPVIFLALVYHDVIPVICRSLDGDLKRIQIAIVVGSIVPVLMFLSWDAVALCITPVTDNGDPIAYLMSLGGAGPSLAIELFSLLAVATSFIGSYLALFEFYIELLSGLSISHASSHVPTFFRRLPNLSKGGFEAFNLKENVTEQPAEKICRASHCESAETNDSGSSISLATNEAILNLASFFFVLIPPVIAANEIPDAFFTAIDFAGSYGTTALYGIFPPIMALSLESSATNDLESNSR